jgi:pSer/pThr/pTyr-binding forkhead associated (FHA) protein
VLYSSGATGAFVNEEEVARPRLLQNGDEVRIGRITLAFTTVAPPGMKLHTPGGAEESAMTRRSTQLDMRAYREDNGGGSRWSSTPVMLGLVALLLAAIAFLLLR